METKPGYSWARFKVWLLIKIMWRSVARRCTSLLVFSATEADSAWQIHRVLFWVDEAEQRAELFEQVLEEMNHSELFAAQYKAISSEPFIPVQREREALYDSPADAWKFFAYCIVGENAAFQRFSHIAHALPTGALRDTFRRILRDEAGHVHSATELAGELGLDEETLKQEIRRVKARRFKEAWMRQGRHITDLLATVFLSVIYFVAAPLGYFTARRKIFGTRTKSVDARAVPSFITAPTGDML